MQRAITLYNEAATQGHANAQDALGDSYRDGEGVLKDDAQAVLWYRKAAEQGHAEAQSSLGWMYNEGRGVEKDDAQAVLWYRKAAEQANATAQGNLGLMYSEGRGVEKNEAQAVVWYRKAAEQGYANAQTNLGWMYEQGRGVQKDDAQSVMWYRKAAEQGYANAQTNLGWMYEQGRGVQKDDAQSVMWYRKAAEQGHARAQTNLGWMYAEGRGVQKDDAQAVLWYRKAAEQGSQNARHNLANVLANGHLPGGVDLEQASVFWRASGHEQSRLQLLKRRPVGKAVAELKAWQTADFKLGTMAMVSYFLEARLPGVALDTAVHAMESAQFNALSAASRTALAQDLREKIASVCLMRGTGEAELDMLMRLDKFGIAEASYQIGKVFDDMGKSHEAQAVHWYRKAAEQEVPDAQVFLGRMYEEGRGVEKDVAQAVLWYRKAAELGNATAQGNLGWMYRAGHGVQKDDAQAMLWYRKAAEQGDARAQTNLGWMYAEGLGVEKDDAQAVLWYRKAAEQGYANAQTNLGWMYREGRGVQKDDAQAVLWYRKAAEQGYARAKFNLGWIYEQGLGVEKDDAQAVLWYRKAAEQGYANAQTNLGWMYREGRGVQKDDAQAVLWYRKAAEQGGATAQATLGWMYEQGRGVQKDDAQAVLWYRKAADQGEVTAQSNLGEMYEQGRGVEKDVVQAILWYRKAAEQGHVAAKQSLERLLAESQVPSSPSPQKDRQREAGQDAIVADVVESRHAEGVTNKADKSSTRPESSAVQSTPDAGKGAKAGSEASAQPLETGKPIQSAEVSTPSRPVLTAGRFDHEIDRLQSGVETAVEQKQWDRAAVSLEAIADWQLAANRVDDAVASRILAASSKDAHTAASFGSEDNYFRLLSSSCSWSEVARFALRVDRREIALATAKLAVNRLQQARRQIGTLGDSLRECFLKVHEDRYRWLADLMVSLGRLGEAEQVLGMLKSFEAEEYVRRGDAPSASAMVELPLDAAQRKLMESANRLTAQAQAATLLGRLRAKAREGPLSADEQAQLEQAQQVLRGAQLQFNTARDSLLADLKALRQNPTEKTGAESQEAAVAAAASIRGTLRSVFNGRAVVVHSVVLPHRTYLLITTADTQQVVQVEVSRDDLSRKVSAFRQSIQSGKSDPQPLARELYRLLIEPILPLIRTPGVDTLMISADGVLRYLPFAALNDGKEYLIEQFAVTSYSPLTRDLLVAKPQRPAWRLAGFGVSHAHGEFPALPNVPAELNAIVRQSGEIDGAVPGERYLDDQFTSQALSDALASNVPALHIASHFRLRHGDRKNSGLLLGKGGLLTLEDLANDHVGFDLSGLELLTLSACETAMPLGDYATAASGSELESLAKLAHESGASAVLATLWPVADQSTARLMAAMYRYLADHPEWSKAQALRHAQIDFIRQRGTEAAGAQGVRMATRPGASPSVRPFGPGHPYFWAPFTLLGNWL